MKFSPLSAVRVLDAMLLEPLILTEETIQTKKRRHLKMLPIKEKKIITGITHDLKQSKITVSGIEDIPGVASKIFKPIGAAGIVVDMIVQNISTNNKTDLTKFEKGQKLEK